ncbi:hypothetical protein ACLESD_14000 [Pyxidicoccus sp. 3LFB2]
MRCLLLLVVVALSGCPRSQGRRSVPVEEDTSIVFPELSASGPVGDAEPHELDGVTLQALVIAANDFLPPDARGRSCWDRQESYRYRVLTQGDRVFVSIHADPDACKPAPRMLDGGAKYAISTDGRILRRLFDGEPEAPTAPEAPDAGPPANASDPTIPVGDTTWGEPQPLPSRFLDGGT